MKKLFSLLLCVLISQLAVAGFITQKEAQEKAQAFLSTHHDASQHHPMRLAAKGAQLSAVSNQAAFYVFNIGEEQGFVVVSGDDRTPAILGYADEGSFDNDNLPENMKAWLKGYEHQLQYLEAHPDAAIAKVQLDEHAAIAPLIKTQWNQGEPYNNLCPLDNGERSKTGCVATAIAQILYYHRYPAKTKAKIPGYTTQGGISVSSIGITTIDWNNMLLSYEGNETANQQKAVANLMVMCGTAIGMEYRSTSSTGHSANVPIALKTYFDYDAATKHVTRTDYRANPWNNLIYNELAEKRPVYYAGQSTGGAHAFVVDGYKEDGLFHINWGWGGNKNGYFLLSILDSGRNSGIGASSSYDGYSFNQAAVIGAQPNTGQTPVEEIKMTTQGLKVTTSTFTKSNNKFNVSFIASIRNRNAETYDFEFGAGIFSANDELLAAQSKGHYELAYNYGWGLDKNFEFALTVSSLPNGTYYIKPISRVYGTSTWYQNHDSDIYYLKAIINGNTLTLKEPVINLTGNLTVSGNKEVGSKQTVKAVINNNGSFFNDIVYLQVNGEDVGGRHFEVEEGSSETVEMTFIPKASGTNTLRLGYKTSYYDSDAEEWKEEFHPIASTTTSIIAAKSYSLTFSNGSVTNATNKTINSSTANIQVTIKNTGNYTYNDHILTWVFKKKNDGSGSYTTRGTIETPLNISAGQQKVVNIDAEDLTEGTYWFIIVYKSDGDYISYNDNKSYRTLYPYVVTLSSPIDDVEVDNDTEYTVYDLQGHRVATGSAANLNSLKKGIYILRPADGQMDSKNSKKIVIR